MRVSRVAIVDAAREMLGTSFVHQGRLPGVGVDCVGLLVCVARRLGIPHRDDPTYTRRPRISRLKEALAHSMVEVPIDAAGAGDALVMRPAHVGLITPDGMIHAHQDVGKVQEHALNEEWRSRIDSAWRFRHAEVT